MMSARYKSLTELVQSVSRGDIETTTPDSESRRYLQKENEERFSVRKLVHRFEASASEHFERTISGRFSSKVKKSKACKEAASKRSAHTNPPTEKCSSTTTWYLESDKITEDNDERNTISQLNMLDRNIDTEDDPFDRISLPDPSELCDSCNEFIYLRLTKAKAEHLNGYDSDFEEADCNSKHVEAINNILALRFPGNYIHYLIYGYYHPTHSEKHDILMYSENDDGFCELETSVFLDHDGATCSEPNGQYTKDYTITTSQQNIACGTNARLTYLIEELLDTERNYINTLEKGISTYIKNVFNKVPIPTDLVNMKYHLFGNIEYIHQFHKSIMLPKLVACGKDVGKIADVFIKYLENDSFYGYVLYSLYHPKSQRLCEQFARFFQDHQNNSGDKLGVKSFTLQPIQRLPRYLLLLNSLVKSLQSSELSSDDETAVQYQSVCKAEREMQIFINTMNDSMEVNEIEECEHTEDDEIEMGFGVPKPVTVLREQNSENQILFLYPKEDENSERSRPINLLHQGKFKKVFPVFLHDLRLRRQYAGKLFIFERCIFYTEQIKIKVLNYRGHFDHQEVTYDFSNQQILKITSEKDNHHAIDVKVDIQNPEVTKLAEIVELLRSIIAMRQKKEGFMIESTELTIIRNAISNRHSSSRSSISSLTSCYSYYNTCGPECIPEVSDYPQTSFAENDQSVDHILSFHHYYEKALKDNVDFYLCSLPNDVPQQLVELNEIILDMLKIQRNLNYRLFEDDHFQTAGSDLNNICDIFHDSLMQSEFEIYLRYVEKSKCAEAILMSFEQYFTGHPRAHDTICLSIDAFLFLPVEYVNRCYEFFDAVWKDVYGIREDVILRNTVLKYKINFVHNQLSLLRQRLNENYYIRQLIMDTEFLNEIELVQYSEIVKLEGSYANYRLFLMKTGLLCMKIKTEKSNKPENYSSVTFYCPYTKSTARNSLRSSTGWSVYLDGRKTILYFENKQKRYLLNARISFLFIASYLWRYH
ncbi:uncharacterized protein LOC131690119 isoform X2 [Topomyia yanbarensis]|uniref:uncharacterized protein LOC131690119 isoform X2 n=1 Tax=Topomyia yanbarensis TaxID=2498891 RepID=UPI00273C2571|nr:uncharacterized protein LOC131690119 isoform X2 [Topomyia yanbarensis]XP_058831640.1 uncharacterized protein LOC131690119 isoform X2 [Topomyia yanbarensis]